MTNMSIGKVSALTGVKVPTVRFYEQIGLLPRPKRTEGDQRRYDAEGVKRLTFIRHARDLGFDVDEIRALISLAGNPDESCSSVDALAREHVERIDAKIRRLRTMRRELMRSIAACKGPRVKNCRIIEALGEPSLPRRR
jgi:DNA-binding transcriptional MerR regulator